jgi:signal transduction histidine kinase
VLRAAVDLSRAAWFAREPLAGLRPREDLPEIDGSPAGLRTVFTNLVINAYHALQEERARDGLRSCAAAVEGDWVVAEVDG